MKSLQSYLVESVDEQLVRELELFAENDRDYYFKFVVPLCKTVQKKGEDVDINILANSSVMKKHVTYIVQAYEKEFGSLGRKLTTDERKALAMKLAEEVFRLIEDGID